MLGNFSCFCCPLQTVFKLTFSKHSFRNSIRVSNGLDPDLEQHSVSPNLDPNCLQRLSVSTSKERDQPRAIFKLVYLSYFLKLEARSLISRWHRPQICYWLLLFLLEIWGLRHKIKWASAWDFQQCGMCDQQNLRTPCAYAQSDQSLCQSLEYSMIIKLLNKHHLEFLVLKGGTSESTLVKMSNCWKSHATAQMTNRWHIHEN